MVTKGDAQEPGESSKSLTRRRSIHHEETPLVTKGDAQEPGESSKSLTRRRSIHHEETPLETWKCKKCSTPFIVKEDKTPEKISEEDFKKWMEIQKEKSSSFNILLIQNQQCKDCCSHGCSVKYLMITMIVLIIAIISRAIQIDVMYFWNRSASTPINLIKSTTSENTLDEQLNRLEKKYKEQDEDTWITLAAGIKSVVRNNPNEPSVFLMLYDSDSAGQTAEHLAQDVSQQAIRFLHGKPGSPGVLIGNTLNSDNYKEDYGKLLIHINDTIKNHGALVITKLNDVHAKVARALHFVCDKYSPLVERTVIFFTLKVDKLTSYKMQIVAQENLKKLWASLESHILNPLVTRMTTYVVNIK